MIEASDDDDYKDVTELDWALYELATIVYYYKLPDEAERKIEQLLRRLAKKIKES